MAKEKKSGGLGKKIADFRAKHIWVDRIMRMNEQYGKARGNSLAGAITYFGFLSIFPLLTVAFAVLAYVYKVYEGARQPVTDALTSALPPQLLGPGGLDITKLSENGSAQASAGLIGLLALLYSGLGWLEAMREALRQMWAVEPQKANIVIKKLKDVFVLALLGTAVLLSAVISALATGFTGTVLGWVGLSENTIAKVFVVVLGLVLAVAAGTRVMTIVFARLPGHKLPWKNVLTGALLAAVGIEVIKQFGSFLISGATENKNGIYATFGIVVGLLIYINFISRVVMYAAAWCVVGPVDTVEEKVAREGETLSQDEAEAASDARDEHDDDESIRLSTKHGTTAGDVPVTTTGVAKDGAKSSSAGGRRRKTAGGGKASESSKAQKQQGSVVDLRDREKAKAAAPSDDSKRASKGSVLSFAGVLALVALRKRGQSRRDS